MISDFESGESIPEYEVDVCIVGSGVAGLTMAREFLGRGRRVLILEAGGKHIEPDSQDCYDAQVIGAPYQGHLEGRYRVFGGTSTRWGGQLLPMDPTDFEPHAHVADSGWPLGFSDLAPWYERALDVLRGDDLPYDHGIWPRMKLRPLPLDESLFRYRYAKWIPFKYRNLALAMDRELSGSRDIEILLNAAVTRVQVDVDSRTVTGLAIRSLHGKQGDVRARYYILCCGAIETARILLASNDINPGGVGNDNDLVGRYFQDHISVPGAALQPRINRAFTDSFSSFFVRDVMHSPRIELTPRAQDKLGCLGVFGQVLADAPEDSGFVVVRETLRRMQAKQGFLPSAAEVGNVICELPYMARLGVSRYLGGKLPVPPRSTWRLAVDVEQEPNPDSRILLTGDSDALGMRRVAIDWRIGERERTATAQFVTSFRSEWERLSLGEANWSEAVFEPGDSWLESAVDTYHQAGTTRMGEDPATSVVDTDLKVHGIDNLYIGSTSVFPTSGSANPTFTMAALCLRLAGLLRARLESAA